MVCEMVTDIAGPIIILAIFLLGFPVFIVMHTGMLCTVVSRIWHRVRGNEELLSKWGLDKEIYGPSSFKADMWAFTVLTFISVVLGVYNYFLLVGIETGVNEWKDIDSQIVREYFTLCGFVWFIALMWNAMYQYPFDKAKALNCLPDEFLNCYKLDVLSLYDGLRHAPPIYWERFAATPVEELTPELLEKFSGYAQPYQHHHSSSQNRKLMVITLAVGGAAIIVTAIGAIFTTM